VNGPRGRTLSRVAMAVDTRTCVGCAACVVACATEHDVAEGFTRTWIVTEAAGRFPDVTLEIRSERCHHCEAAPCVGACPTGASYVGPGGTVQVDGAKCTGCKACMAACPYGARFVDPRTRAVDKCTFCAHQASAPEGWSTACAVACPTDSIHFGDLDDPDGELARLLTRRRWRTLLAEAGTRPRLFFLE
jgi:Fe-S-cluster-containing dehydrogenase component